MSEIYIDTQSVQFLAQEIALAIRGGLEVDPERERRARIDATARAIYAAQFDNYDGLTEHDCHIDCDTAYRYAAALESSRARFLAAERKEVQ